MDKLWDLLPQKIPELFELANSTLDIPAWIVLFGILIWWIERKTSSKK